MTSSDQLRITIYDGAHLSREVVLDALHRLRVILGNAKVVSNPVLGNADDPEASLFMYADMPSSGDEPGIGCRARRDIAVKIVESSPKSLPKTVLGMSSPYAESGLNIRVFNDHISEAALGHDLPYTIVLSYAMAHEIGHVLLKNGKHSHCGIMSSIWTGLEYEQMARSGLVFSGDEVKIMSANLRVPVCQKPDRGPIAADR